MIQAQELQSSFSVKSNQVGLQLFVFGGFQQKGFSNELKVFDLQELKWKDTDSSGQIPQARQGSFTVQQGNIVYLFGGCNQQKCFNDLYQLDLNTLIWYELEKSFQDIDFVQQASGDIIGNLLYIFGGCNIKTLCNNILYTIQLPITCYNSCSNNGKCSSQGCECNEGFQGFDCSISTKQQKNCHDNGILNEEGKCVCFIGFKGNDCEEQVECPQNCTSLLNGVCQSDGSCLCNFGYQGEDCSCRCLYGSCQNEICNCDEGWKGVQCDIKIEVKIFKDQDNRVIKEKLENSLEYIEDISNTQAESNNEVQESQVQQNTQGYYEQILNNYNSQEEQHNNYIYVSQDDSAFEQQQYNLKGLPQSNTQQSISCPHNCYGNGICDSNICYCFEEFIGKYCDKKITQDIKPYQLLILSLLSGCLLGYLVAKILFRSNHIPNKGLDEIPSPSNSSVIEQNMLSLTLIFQAVQGCRNFTQLHFPDSRRLQAAELPYCKEHQLRTCCDAQNAFKVYKIMGKALENPPIFEDYAPLSQSCIKDSETVLCSLCDGYMDIGRKRGLKPWLCDQWYNSCIDDYFTEGMNELLDFCTWDDLTCSKLSWITSNSTEFCNQMGFEVNEKRGYDAEPAASLKPMEMPVKEEKQGVPITVFIVIGVSVVVVIGVFILLIRAAPFEIKEKEKEKKIFYDSSRLKLS